jgi:hypothetical protein
VVGCRMTGPAKMVVPCGLRTGGEREILNDELTGPACAHDVADP